jgi:hypothetical protein
MVGGRVTWLMLLLLEATLLLVDAMIRQTLNG